MRKTLLITGGSVNIGKAIIKMFAELDWNIVFTFFRSEQNAYDTCNSINL